MNSKKKVGLKRTSDKIEGKMRQSTNSIIGEDHHSYDLQEIDAKNGIVLVG